ncbi:ABC transporter ATP-binding protein/permease [bacterium]|nr:ABC transporter ATP-binding protein/permease [bacterium]
MFILIGTCFEILGIGMIIPVIIAVMDPTFIDQYPELGRQVASIFDPTHQNIIVFGIACLVGFYVVKTSYLVFLAYWQGLVIYDIKEDLGRRLFTGYMLKSYEFYLDNNTAQLLRNVTSEVHSMGVVLRAGMVLFVDGVVTLAVVALLIYVEPIGTLSIFLVLSSAGFVFQTFTKKPLLRFGKARQFNDGKRIQHVQQGLASVKDVKILGRESTFISWFNKHNAAGIRAERFQYTLAAMPRLFLEFLVVIGLAILILILIFNDRDIESISLVLGVYAVAIFRLLPSVNRILGAMQQIRFCLPSIQVIGDELVAMGDGEAIILENKLSRNRMSMPVLSQNICINSLFFKHSGSENSVLKNINMIINAGSFIGIVGGSGAGKSTLVDLLLGLLNPDSGEISVDGSNIHANIAAWQQQIGYVSQHIYLTDDTIRNNIALGVDESDIDENNLTTAINSAQLRDVINGLPERLETVIGEQGIRLSGGQRQRIGIARALYHNPKVLILDEATSALDQDTESEVMATVSALQGQKTIILVTHRLKTLVDCDRIYRFENGEVVSSSTYREIIEL